VSDQSRERTYRCRECEAQYRIEKILGATGTPQSEGLFCPFCSAVVA